MGGERKYKSGTILTDGTSLIYLGLAWPKDWTPTNNYGRKQTDYSSCRTFPDNLFVNGIQTIRKDYSSEILGLWFQKGYHLYNFRPINKKLINTEILNGLRGTTRNNHSKIRLGVRS